MKGSSLQKMIINIEETIILENYHFADTTVMTNSSSMYECIPKPLREGSSENKIFTWSQNTILESIYQSQKKRVPVQ